MRLPSFAPVANADFHPLTAYIPFVLREDREDAGGGAPCRRRESETNPTSKAVSSCSIVIESTSERPQQSSFQTTITSSWRCLAALSRA
jgi:hypothetical protein